MFLLLSMMMLAGIDEPLSALEPQNKQYNYYEAYEEHILNNKPILILVYAKWCTPCNKFKADILPTVLMETDRRKYCFVEIDSDAESGLASVFRPDTFPYIVLYTKDNNVYQGTRFNWQDKQNLIKKLNGLNRHRQYQY